MAIDAAVRLWTHSSGGMLALFVEYDLREGGYVDRLVGWWLALGPTGTAKHLELSRTGKQPPFRWAERMFSVRPAR